MKSLIKAIFQALTKPGTFDSGEFLPTRRKAHLLYAEMYARVARDGEENPSHSEPMATAAVVIDKKPARSVNTLGSGEIAA
jgi:hypothetical protein